MSIVRKIVTGVVITVGTEIVAKKVLPAAIKKGRKILKDLEDKAAKKGE
jgi:hypothetical protein